MVTFSLTSGFVVVIENYDLIPYEAGRISLW
jgi:hypothetical protein